MEKVLKIYKIKGENWKDGVSVVWLGGVRLLQKSLSDYIFVTINVLNYNDHRSLVNNDNIMKHNDNKMMEAKRFKATWAIN